MTPNLIKSTLLSVSVHFFLLMPFFPPAPVSNPPRVDLAAGTSSVELEWVAAPEEDGEESVEEIRPGRALPDSWVEDVGVVRSAAEAGAVINPAPLYPRVARVQGWEGTTVIRVLVNPSGVVASARVAQGSGHSVLDGAALTAVRQWKFQPARRKGQAVASQVEVPIRFRLKDQDEQ